MNTHDATLKTLRGFLLVIFVFGLLGASAELLLIGHTENFRQWIPLYATALSLVLALGLANTLKSQVGKDLGVLNPNLAGEKELLALPPLNAKLVKQILDKRPFLRMTALDTLLRQSLSREQLAELYPKLFIPINLNTATREGILLVPGVGKRMAHEFEEYRPYRAMAQFRREIGKYVDKREVARLERYVTLE